LGIDDLQWQLMADVLQLSFSLPAGGYATSVLRECVRYS
jgi:tRNA(Glu) U13 pseudouridine synthase TruD